MGFCKYVINIFIHRLAIAVDRRSQAAAGAEKAGHEAREAGR